MVSMVRDVVFSSLFLCVFIATCFTCLHLRNISLLIMSALPLNYVLWLFWFHFSSRLDPILSISDWMLQSVSLTMDNCLICCKRVLPHAKQVNCYLCHLIIGGGRVTRFPFGPLNVFVYISHWAAQVNSQNRPHFEEDYRNWWLTRARLDAIQLAASRRNKITYLCKIGTWYY